MSYIKQDILNIKKNSAPNSYEQKYTKCLFLDTIQRYLFGFRIQ